ncbi:MAG: radical SAM protein [Chloroflexi bacterium]|jgi:hypothetical protein|nr:radical SAM protein [Chloroflexota bacterium]
MVILGKWADRSITISAKPNCLTLSLGGAPQAEVLSSDNTGRIWTAMLEGVSYRRGLNGRVVAKWIDAYGERQRRWLSPEECTRFENRIYRRTNQVLDALQRGEIHLETPLPAGGQAQLAQAASFDAGRSQQDVATYHQVYRPIGILPPDQYMAVVLQLTEGCSFNTCTFCNFYRERKFRIKPPAEFQRHTHEVEQFLGAGLSLRRTLFLGDANALVVPMPRLVPAFEIVHKTYDVEALGGIYAFLDGFSGERKSVEDYRTLVAMGLKRVYIGMESGSANLLSLLRKPGKPSDVIETVNAIKAAGGSVGLILLLGAGGHQYARAHVDDSVRAINHMDLDLDDIVYFSELIESEGLEYTQLAYQEHLDPLTPAERIAQGTEMEAGFAFSAQRGEPHVSRYDIREFVY